MMVGITAFSEWRYFGFVMALGIVAITFIVARMIVYIFTRYSERFATRTKTQIDDIIIGAIKRPLYIFMLFVGIYFALRCVKFPWISQAGLVVKTTGTILGTWVALRVFPAIIREYGLRLAKRTQTKFDDVMVPFIERITKLLLVIIGILIILAILQIRITPMLAGLGIAGMAIALAMQDTLSNIFSGFYLMADRPFKLEDRLVLDTGELCEVKDIGLRSTRLYNVIDHTLIVIPNLEVSKMKIVNLSEPDVKLKVRVPIGVAYGSDMDKVKKVLVGIARQTPMVLQDPPPVVLFNEFSDCSLNLQLIVWIDDIKEKLTVIDCINSMIKRRFEQEGIEIPFPIRTIYTKKE